MKKIILLLIGFISTIEILSQAGVTITPGTTVKSKRGVYLVINKMNIVNKGALQQEQNNGTVKFTGNRNDSIYGNGVTVINILNLAKSSGTNLTLQKNISVRSEIIFNSGRLNLGNYEMDLGSNGVLTNESELNRAYTTGTGFIKSTILLNSPSGINPGNLGATISSPVNLGSTIIRRGHKVQANVFGTNNSIQRYFDIIPANNSNINATLRLYYFDGELNTLNESVLSQWWSSNNINWTSVCNNTRNTVNNYIESNGINNFSRWTVSNSTPPLNVSIPNAYAVTQGGAANTFYIGYGPSSITLNAQVTGGAAPYTYKWTAGSSSGPALNSTSTFTVSPTTSTTYYLNVKDAFGCNIAAVTRQINVVDVRCGTKSDKVTVCKFQNGSYSPVCVTNGTVAGLLAGGSYLGACNSPVTLATSVPEKSSSTEKVFHITAFPNPSEKHFNLMVEGNDKEDIQVTVYNVTGILMHQVKGTANRSYKFGEKWIAGMYYVLVKQGNEVKTIQVIKQ